jgi:ketosteroid isomerase-like protein
MASAADISLEAWDAYIRGDLAGVMKFLDPAIEWDLTNYEGWPEDPVYYGHAGVKRFLNEWLGNWDRYEAGVDEVVQLDDQHVFTVSWQRGYGAGSHVPAEMRLAEIATFRDELLVRFELWSDIEAARAAAREATLAD